MCESVRIIAAYFKFYDTQRSTEQPEPLKLSEISVDGEVQWVNQGLLSAPGNRRESPAS